MAIVTLDGVLAGMQVPSNIIKTATPTLVIGRPHSLLYLAGTPGAAVAPAPGIAGAALTTYPGQIPFSNPVAGNSYLARFVGQATVAGRLLLCDRLWHNSGMSITATTAQTINSVAWPARSADGTVNGVGIQIGVEVSTILGAGAPIHSISYTNQAGTSGKTGTGIITGITLSAVGAFYMIGLAAGDTGVRSIQTYTRSVSSVTGVEHLVAFRILASLDLTLANTPNSIDAISSGFPRLFDNTVLFLLFIPAAVSASVISGQVVITQG